MAETRKFSMGQRIACAVREVDKRRSVYPRLVSQGKMRQSEADYEIACMQDIADTLSWLERNQAAVTAAVANAAAEKELAAKGGAS